MRKNPKNQGKNADTIEKLLLSLQIIQTDVPILKRFGRMKAILQREGISLSDADILIGSATLEKADKLITGNTKHFERIPGLVLEDWR